MEAYLKVIGGGWNKTLEIFLKFNLCGESIGHPGVITVLYQVDGWFLFAQILLNSTGVNLIIFKHLHCILSTNICQSCHHNGTHFMIQEAHKVRLHDFCSLGEFI